jgi:hypothetical protein
MRLRELSLFGENKPNSRVLTISNMHTNILLFWSLEANIKKTREKTLKVLTAFLFPRLRCL